MMRLALILVLAFALVPTVLILAAHLALRRGAWRVAGVLGSAVPYVAGPTYGRRLAFLCQVLALRESAQLEAAAALARDCLADETVPMSSRNAAIDVLISAGGYEAALAAEPPPEPEVTGEEATSRALIQLNLAEAEYNLGGWDAAEERLRRVQASCQRIALTRAWLGQQRAWIAAHRGRGEEALVLCAAVDPRAIPRIYESEYHFTVAVALLCAGRLEEAQAAVAAGERAALRLSSRRNALFLRARVAAARPDWTAAERLCREAAQHPFRGQGGAGLLLWARALRELGRPIEAEDALRLACARDPESESARTASATLSSFWNDLTTRDSTPG